MISDQRCCSQAGGERTRRIRQFRYGHAEQPFKPEGWQCASIDHAIEVARSQEEAPDFSDPSRRDQRI